MGSVFTNFALNSLLRTLVSIVAQAIATKLALDASQTDQLTTWLAAGAAQLVVFGPILYNQWTRPSNAAMTVAEQTDKVLAGVKTKATVETPHGKPDIVITAKNANIGHS